MNFPLALFLPGLLLTCACAADLSAAGQFVVLNLSHTAPAEAFAQIHEKLPTTATNRVRVGVGGIFSFLNQPRAKTREALREFLRLSQETDTPVVVQLDGESWWNGRPDLWNWWDPARPGFNPANRDNVEWTNWTPDAAIKIAWRNWGRQIRILPPPNLMSPRYRAACHEEMDALVPVILHWWRALPTAQRDLLIGIKVGWESSIGVNAWYYPDGNRLLDQPVSDDPTSGVKINELPGRGVQPIGYAAVSTAGLRHSGELTEADLAEVVRRHLADLCREAARLGVPRDRLFTHCGGWKDGELLYQSALNPDSCPGWSFYRHAADPGSDRGVQDALRRSDAPYWGAVEWLYQGPRQAAEWRRALAATLSKPRCRYLCIYNWEGIRDSQPILDAIRQSTAGAAAH